MRIPIQTKLTKLRYKNHSNYISIQMDILIARMIAQNIYQRLWLLLLLIFFGFEVIQISAKFEFTNVNCTSLDETFIRFDSCYLKSLNRTYKYLTVNTNMYKLPLTNLKINIEVLKRLNGYKPFLFNFTVDACKFLANQRNSLNQYFYDLFAPYTNANHRCPFNHNLHLEKLPISHLNHMVTTVLPMPEGDYCIHSVWTVHGKQRVDMNVYFSIS